MDTNSTITGRTTTNSISSVRYMSVTAMLSAVAFILMFLDFSVPFMPAFIKMDLSELPALIGAFSMGPVCGILICLIKNVLHLFITTTGGVGELSNFLLGVAFVLPAGLIYRHKKSRRSALIGSLFGAVIMGVFQLLPGISGILQLYAGRSCARRLSGDRTIHEEHSAVPGVLQYAVYHREGTVFRGNHIPGIQTHFADSERSEPLEKGLS